MRKFLIAIILLSLVLPIGLAIAREDPGPTDSSGNGMDIKTIFTGGSLEVILDRAKGYVFTFGLVAAVIMVLWAGIQFITSAGDAKKVAAARNTIKNALIGVVVIILAESLILILRSILAV
ncbi:MAG TPA: hypothetical protein PK547_02140 [Candidatus Paceibacterota bacterium]|nr:hypothetical protein [Candidatus Paceibacterota bacterium]